MTASLDVSSLEALLESARLLHASLELDDLLRHLLRTAMGRLLAPRGLVAVADEGGTLRVRLARGCRDVEPGQPFDADRARQQGLTWLASIGDAARPAGVLALGPTRGGDPAPGEAAFLEALSGLAASGLANARAHQQLRQLNRHLDQKVHELSTLLGLLRALSAADGPDEVAHLLGRTLAGQWASTRYAVLCVRRGHPPIVRQSGTALSWDDGWLPELEACGAAVLVEDLAAGRLRPPLIEANLALLLPLRSANGCVGFAGVGARPGRDPFTEADLAFAAGLAAQAAVALENAWHQREVVERKQFERELALAASIQQGLFPAALPVIPGYAIAAITRPARLVGGDYYDALIVDAPAVGRRGLFCVADVSGKGLAASLLMSSIQASLRALLGREPSLGELVRCINDLLHDSTPGNKYATAVLLSLDPASGACRYVSAGHPEALLLTRGGAVRRLGATGLALGLFPAVSYEEGQFTLEPGDLVALYSDGISEAQDLSEAEYGAERLIASLRCHAGQPADALVRGVLGDLEAFVGEAAQYDDITLLVVRRDT